MRHSLPEVRVNPRNGIVLKILSALCATLMLACVKGLNGMVPTGQVVFFRSFVALVPLLIWLGMRGHILDLVRTKNFGGHLVRGLSGTGACSSTISRSPISRSPMRRR